MSTNWYWEREPSSGHCACGGPLYCRACEPDGREHIGLSAIGWTFSFHATESIASYQDWLRALATGGRIISDSGITITAAEFEALVEARQGQPHNHAREHPATDTFLDPEGYSFHRGEFS